MAGLRSIPTLKTPGPKSPAGITPNAPPAGKVQGRPLPDLGRPVIAPRGPAHLRLGQKRVVGTGGPGPPPATFPGSGAEWVWFWASAKYHHDPSDPRSGLFTGGSKGEWVFSDPIGIGVTAARDPGEATGDFTYLAGGGNIIVFIEGTYWHLGQGGAQQARDLYRIGQTGGTLDRVHRVNDSQFMFDVTGAAAIKLLADILAGRPPVGALHGGTVEAPRYADYALGVA